MKNSFTQKILLFAVAGLMAVNAWGQPKLATEYCNTTMGSTEEHGAAVGFTWETNSDGDVVITLSEVDGGAAGTALFRNDGMCPVDLSRFKVGGGNASNYFEREFTAGTQTYILKLKDGVDAPAFGATITFTNQLVEYKTSLNNDAWPNLSFSYTYGSKCATLDKPTNIAISAEKVITFDAVTGATSYKAYVYWGDELFYEQVVTNDGTLDYHPSLTGTYHVYLQAYGSEEAFSPVSDAIDWELIAELAYLPQSEWCDRTYETHGDNESEDVNVKWITDRTGNIIVTLSPVEGNEQTQVTAFRAALAVGNLKIGEDNLEAYFTSSYSGNVNTFALIDPANKPVEGTIITYNGLVEYKTGTHGNCWPTLTFNHVYGSTCNGYNDHTNPIVTEFSVEDKDVTSITFHVAATDADDLGTSRAIASYSISSENHGFVTTEVTPDGDGNFTVSGLKDNETYTFTIHAIDLIGNEGTRDLEVTLPFNPALNLSLGRGDYCTAGAVQNDNVASRAVDGNAESFWTCFGQGDASTTWWQMDLGVAYDVNQVVITFNDIAAAYNIYCSTDNSNWITVVEGETASSGSTKTHSELVLTARYFKVTSSSNHFGIKEFEVYGTAFSVPDATNPTVTVTCPAKTINSATLQINASDLVDGGAAGAIAAINITGDNGFVTQNNVTLDGSNQITLEGLTYNTTYTFTITVFDRARNQASANIEVQLPLNTNLNLAQGKTAVAGKTQAGNDAYRGCDGNEGTMWSSYGTQDQSKEWWYVDLGALYTIRQVKIKWMNDYSIHFLIQGATTLPDEEVRENDDAWTTYLDYTYESDPGTDKQTHNVVGKMRYLRLKSIQNEIHLGMEFYELEVYGSDYATEDNEAPVLGTASATTDTETATATLTLTATDAVDGAIKDFYISCANPVMAETKYTTNGDDQIAISGLEVDKDYMFDIRCRDLSGNWLTTNVLAHFSMALGTNVAEGKTATVGRDEGGHIASHAVDGNDATYWGCYPNTTGVTTTWLKVDLSNAYKLENIAIKWEHYPDNGAGGIIIEGSLNDEDYSTIISYSGDRFNQGDRQVLEITGAQAEIPYKYIRVKAANQDYYMSIYEFEVYASEEIPFASFGDAATTNAATIAALHNSVVAVQLNRSLIADGYWYTLCLPFDMSADEVTAVFGSSTIAEMTGAEDRGTLIHLNFNYVNAIEAGHPYLFKPGNDFAAGTIIEGVTINNVTPIVAGDALMHFQGIYDATTLTGDNIRFVGDDDYLYSPRDGGTPIGAFRCYFTIPDGSPAAAPGRKAKLFFGDENPTGMDQISEKAAPAKIMMNGVLYIIRDGRTYNAQGIQIK